MGFGQIVFSLCCLLWDLGEVPVLATPGLRPWGLFLITQVWDLPPDMYRVASVLLFGAEIVSVVGESEKLGQCGVTDRMTPEGRVTGSAAPVCILLLPF